MKKQSIFLFSIRLFFYFSVIMLIPAHPGITVSFDRIGILQWFVIIPIQALIAFLPEGKPFVSNFKFNLRSRYLIAFLSLFLFSIWAGGFSPSALTPFFAGIISFTLTYLLFHYPKWAKLAVLEPFFLAWVCLRLLALSRSGEEIAGQGLGLTQFVLVWTVLVFLFHCAVVYFCLYPKSFAKMIGEGTALLFSAAVVMVFVFIFLTPDFINNTIIENLLSERMPELIREESDRGIPREGDGRREGRRTLPRSEDGRQPGLRGISEYNWQNMAGRGRGRNGSADNRQYMVKIVASPIEPVYMGDSFRGHLDPEEGFLESTEEPLNRIVHQRFFVTWFNSEPEFDIGRRRREVFSLSTLPQKYLPWRPVSIDPTILNEDAGPLRYIHQVVSNIHQGDPIALVNVPSRSFNNLERSSLASYLLLPLYENDMEVFRTWLNEAMETWSKDRETLIRNDRYLWSIYAARSQDPDSAEYLFLNEMPFSAEKLLPDVNLSPVNEQLETILAILTGFSRYQYNLTYDDSYSIANLKDFLLLSEEGDCVEFSNTLALLGRLAGIPSRVVTGYLAAEGLQTDAHLRGLAALRQSIPLLQEFPFDNLYMVTNLHSHSWTQFYIPDYGWLDFEATSFALPPVGMGDFNTWDVIIPIIDEDRVFSAIRKFPWRAVLRAAGALAVFALAFAYVLRYGREAVLLYGTRRGGREGARSLYLLLLARLAADGKPIKPASKTALEYSELFPGVENPHLPAFAMIYSELRWREYPFNMIDSAKRHERFESLVEEYHNILKTTRRKGIWYWLIRIISLRGLAYL